MNRLITIILSVVFLVIQGRAPSSAEYISYSEEIQNTGGSQIIDFYVSNLDSIKPYYHVYPSGVETEAPNLDPRDFCTPDSVFSWFEAINFTTTATTSIDFGLPLKKYEIIGEVEVLLKVLKKPKPKSVFLDSGEDDLVEKIYIESFTMETKMAPNNKAYNRLTNVDWKACFDDLNTSAAEAGADAVIEIFCGKGVSSFWYPPTLNTTATYGPGGKVVGSYSYSTPGGIGLRGWEVKGLAIRWKE